MPDPKPHEPEAYEPETNPNVPWYERGGFTTIAMISLVLGLVCWLAIGGGAVFGDFSLVRGFLPFPAFGGLVFGLLGFLGPWRIVAGAGALLNLAAVVFAMFL
ncbi:hypothetical protein GCM10011490_26880 [Pseudoclavibacter endophyticus]|uniref:Uncharacterized protein n=1 Tax=Pseudoclavibacter endophyticus TaxID=1778590 RepID=A0A6H9WNP5_9MICO|nr:hypothetical protein [Pseudoclavibacter endophyticus]KAB1646875.1 hypothetical protein F8O04_14210 [Pseudoclavibacter endophyticus]GGA74787.1 hypothetical protein GCM10011490_26880 [Pseudoclavibacter endophyticus]